MLKNSSLLSNFKILWPIYAFYFILIYLVQNNSFFWDKDIIFSRLAQGMLENGPGYIFNNSVDVGYFTGLAFILAGSWKLFGISLPVMHWLMLPVSIGVAYEVYRYLRNYIPAKYLFLAVIIVLLDPTLMAQSVMYSTDLFQVYFFFTAINAILNNKRGFLTLSLLASVMVHGRGVLTVASIFFIEIAYHLIDKKISRDNWFKTLLGFSWAYIPAVVFTIGYFIIHYIQTGWIGFHDESPWAGCYAKVDFVGFLKNILITAWRIVDFGRVFVYLALLIILILLKRNDSAIFDKSGKKIAATGIIFLALNLPNMLLYKLLSDHRYIIIFFIIVSAFVCYLLFNKVRNSRAIVYLSLLVIIGLGTGNLWVYPDKVAQGWSGTLAHLPFYKQRLEMLAFIKEENISFSDIGSDTPNKNTMKTLYLTDEDEGFNRKDLSKNKYVYYSNIINVFSDEEYDELKNNWVVVKEIERFGVKTILYKNPLFVED